MSEAMPREAGSWLAVAGDCWLLGAEAAAVVPLRLARLAKGGNGAREEARLMVMEKIEAHSTLAGALAGGEMGRGVKTVTGGVVAHYLGYVRANRIRLAEIMLGSAIEEIPR